MGVMELHVHCTHISLILFASGVLVWPSLPYRMFAHALLTIHLHLLILIYFHARVNCNDNNYKLM